MKKDTQRMLPVIRVDMEAPLIECYVDASSFKGFVKGVRRVVTGGWNNWGTKQQTVMDQILVKISQMMDVDMFTEMARSNALRVHLNDLMTSLKNFFEMLPGHESFNLDNFDYVTNKDTAYDPSRQRQLSELLQRLYTLIKGRKSAKPDLGYVVMLGNLYNELVNAVTQKTSVASGLNPRSLPPFTLYSPVLLRTP